MDAELDRIYEAAVAQDWEEQNAANFPGMDEARKKVNAAEKALSEALVALSEAGELLEGSTESDRLFSLSDEVEFLWKDVLKQIERMKT